MTVMRGRAGVALLLPRRGEGRHGDDGREYKYCKGFLDR